METRKRGRWWRRVMTPLLCGAIVWFGLQALFDTSRGPRPDPYLEAANDDTQDIERLSQAKSPQERFHALGYAARVRLKQRRFHEARNLAEELLGLAPQFSQNWDYGNAIHDGHIVLGYLALEREDVKGAAQHLIAAGSTPGSPQLDSFGPNMSLARRLLQQGARGAVLEYLELCRRFWEGEGDRLDSWRRVVESGGIPDFGVSLIH